MHVGEAAAIFADYFQNYYQEYGLKCDLPRNKQRGDKAGPAFFTNIINILIAMNADGYTCDYNPQQLTTITRNKQPLRTLSRRVDGAFPGAVNPIALWEIKEYYYSEENFGSRIADSVYETQVDGMELHELFQNEKIKVKHYLMVDGHNTWWYKGKSYLCRIVDLLHMGYADEVLFGREVLERLPELVTEWVQEAKNRNDQSIITNTVAPLTTRVSNRIRRETTAEKNLRLNQEWVEQYLKNPSQVSGLAEATPELNNDIEESNV